MNFRAARSHGQPMLFFTTGAEPQPCLEQGQIIGVLNCIKRPDLKVEWHLYMPEPNKGPSQLLGIQHLSF